VKGVRLVHPAGILENAALAWEEGRIVFVGSVEDAPSGWDEVVLDGLTIAPGLIDTHVHGAVGCDFMMRSKDAYGSICKTHAAGGTTSLLVTTVTAALEDVYEVLKFAEAYRTSGNAEGSRILGAHIEGPFLSPQRPGIHDTHLMRTPTIEIADRLFSAGLAVRLITLAPELPGSAEFIAYIQSKGALASGGHSDAWESDLTEPFHAGLRRVTHTFNCMSTARKRGPLREAGLLEFALSEPAIRCEAIADGAHIPQTLLRMLYRAKGEEGITLITDASSACGLKEGEEFEIAGTRCRILNGLALAADGSALAGSCLTMWEAVCGMVRLVEVPLHVAIGMASWIPARDFGWADEMGELKVGSRADFIVFDHQMRLKATFMDGNLVASKEV